MCAEQRKGPGNEEGRSTASGNTGVRFSAKYVAYDGANQVVEDEVAHLERWRGRAPQVGLSLSGGGIRSATYCLGVLQALAHKGVLPQVDYLSTVSGGGYIGSSLTYLLHQSASSAGDLPKLDVSAKNFPYVSYPMVSVGGERDQVRDDAEHASEDPERQGADPTRQAGESSLQWEALTAEKLKGRLLRRLRQSSNYLVPGDGITVLSLAGVVVRNLAASLAVHVALLVVLFQILFWSTWSQLGRLPEGAPSQRGSLASVWSGVASTGQPVPSRIQPAPAKPLSTTTESKSISSVVTTGSGGTPATTSEVASVTTGTQATVTTAAAARAERFRAPAPDGFLRLAGYLLCAFALASALYLVATRFFDGMEREAKPDQPTGPKGGGRYGPYWVRRLYERSTHWLLVVVVALLVVGGIPWVHAVLVENSLLSQLPKLLSGGESGQSSGSGTGIIATLIGVVGNVWGFLQARSSKKPLIPTGLIVGVASAALFFGLLLLVYILTGWMHVHWSDNAVPRIAVVVGLVLLLVGWLPEVNYASLHRFYRDRLLELFLPDLRAMNRNMLKNTRYLPLHLFLWSEFKRLGRGFKPWRRGAQGRGETQEMAVYARIGVSVPGDATMLGDVCGVKQLPPMPEAAEPGAAPQAGTRSAEEQDALKKRGPYHIINANLVLVASQDPRFRPRGGDNFIFSPLFCGSRATGWAPTDATRENGFTLATAMAISGAAVNPNAGPGGQGITRQPVLSVLMGLLNLRLGYWVRNPRPSKKSKAQKQADSIDTTTKRGQADGSKRPDLVKPNAIYPGLLESFGRFNLNENARYLLLTDGGHFENLGLYELVRRRLKLIIVCDATADPGFKFTDLSNAIQKVRADFGAIIDVSAEQLAALVPGAQDAATTAGAGKDDREPADVKSVEAGPKAAARGHLIVPIRYSKRLWPRAGGDARPETTPQDPDDPDEMGTLILLKATACQGLPADLFSYRRDHPEFPNQGTIDQFFDERQFDAYRELGFHTTYQMLAELPAAASSSAAMFERKCGYWAQTPYAVAQLLFDWREPQTPGSAVSDRLAY